jgi:hypothetical protein
MTASIQPIGTGPGWLREHAARLTGVIGERAGRGTSAGRMADGALQAGGR